MLEKFAVGDIVEEGFFFGGGEAGRWVDMTRHLWVNDPKERNAFIFKGLEARDTVSYPGKTRVL
jgi:hypothetical protein